MQMTTTNRLVDAPRLRQGERSLGALAVRSAQKTVGLMDEWKLSSQARLQKVPVDELEDNGKIGKNARKAKLFDDISEEEEKVALGQYFDELSGVPVTPEKRPEGGLKALTELVSKINDPADAAVEHKIQQAWLMTGKMPPLPMSSATPALLQLGEVGSNRSLDRTAAAPSVSLVVPANGTVPVATPPSLSLASRAAAAPSLSLASRATAALNETALAARLARLQQATGTASLIRFQLGKMQQMMANLAVTTTALKDNLACVRQELEEAMESSTYVPRWVIKMYGVLTFAGTMVWRLFMAMLVSRASTYTMASRLLHASDTYMLLLWQGIVANAAQLSQLGPYGSNTWLGTKWWLPLEDVPPNLILPG